MAFCVAASLLWHLLPKEAYLSFLTGLFWEGFFPHSAGCLKLEFPLLELDCLVQHLILREALMVELDEF